MVNGDDRLVRAIAAVLDFTAQAEPKSRADFLAAHADLRELIEPMLDEVAADASPAGALGAAPPRLGDYLLLRELGRGGMGVVFEALQPDVDRRVAVKVLPPHVTRTPAAVARFKREAALVARLHHPGIAEVYAVGSNDDTHFFAMELVEGVALHVVLGDLRAQPLPTSSATLRDAVDRRIGALFPSAGHARQPSPHWVARTHVAAAARIAAEVADALQHAHAAQVIHRDVKPANILLRRDGRAVVTDFGVARDELAPHMTVTGEFAGTACYAAPEQLAGARAADHKSDVFSLGVTLYELLTLRRPFTGDTALEVAAAIARHDPPSPRQLSTEVPDDLAAIVLMAIEKEPSRRYQSAGEFAADLRAFLDGRPVAAQHLGPWRRLLRLAQRNPLSAALTSALALTLLVAAVWIAVQNHGLRQALANVRRLADLGLVTRLLNDHNHLPAAHPDDDPVLERWIADARLLVANVPLHRARLVELRGQALPYSDAERARDRDTHPERSELLKHQGRMAQARADLAEAAANPDRARAQQVEAWQTFLAGADALEAHLQAAVATRRTWTFAKPHDQWEHGELSELVRRCDEFLDPNRGTWDRVHRWREHMRSVRQRTLVAAAHLWQVAIADLADPARAPAYRGLHLTPQLGLVPLGKDAASGLHEFAHVQTGTVPTRDHDGRLRIDDGTGLVFVLLPGGAFRMGATPMDAAPDPAVTNRDQMAREDEQPEHTVTLAPFFLSKYEMTQAQWQRFLGRNPSQFRAGTWRGEWRASWRHPVETVSWVTCDEVMRAMRLALPTEAQWEYAARAGSGAQFGSHGEGKTALIGAVNALDRQTAQLFRSQADTDFGADFDDGQGALAAVGTFAANAFGLHDMFGNVMEWCADRFCTYSDPTRPGDGLRDGRMAHGRVLRGGSYVFGAAELRVAHRMSATDWTSAAEVGLRPARAVER